MPIMVIQANSSVRLVLASLTHNTGIIRKLSLSVLIASNPLRRRKNVKVLLCTNVPTNL